MPNYFYSSQGQNNFNTSYSGNNGSNSIAINTDAHAFSNITTEALFIDTYASGGYPGSHGMLQGGFGSNYMSIFGPSHRAFSSKNRSGGPQVTRNTVVPVGFKWTHFAAVASGNIHSTYIDGVFINSSNQLSGGTINFGDFMVGNWQNPPVNYSFEGCIEYVRIWDYPRTIEEIRETMYKDVPSSHSGLANSWKFNETSGNIVKDYGYLAKDLTMLNGATRNNLSFIRQVKPNGSILFGGSARAQVPNVPEHDFGDSQDFSVEYWSDFSSNGLSQRVVNKGTATTTSVVASGWVIIYDGGDTNRVIFSSGGEIGATDFFVTNPLGINDGNFHHVVFTFDRDLEVKVYADGVLKQTTPLVTNYTLSSAEGLDLGGQTSTPGFNFLAKLSEVRLWNKVLSSGEVLANYNASRLYEDTNLVGYYRFDDGLGTTVTDYSGNGNDATIINTYEWKNDSGRKL